MKKLYILLCFFILLSSCNNENENFLETNNSEFTFTIMKTKAGDTSFSIGDEIGVYAVVNGQSLQSAGNFADNKRFRWNGSAFVPVDEANKILTAPGLSINFYAYYPYSSSFNSATSSTFNVATDQSSDITSSDFMSASFIGANYNTNIPLTFTHLMTTIEVNFHKGNNSITNAKILARYITAQNMNIANDSYAVMGSKYDISLYKYQETPDVVTYRAIIPIQSISSGSQIFSFLVNGTLTRSYIANEFFRLGSGTKNTYNVYLAYKITASAGTGGTVSGAGNYNVGSTCNLVATPNSGYKFSGWYESGTQISSDANYSFSPTADRSITAAFAVNETYETSYTVSVSPSSFNFIATGGSHSFTVTCNKIVNTYVDGTLTNTSSTASTDYSVSVSGTGFSLSGNQVIAADNNSTLSRMGILTVTAGSAATSADLLQDGKINIDVDIIN